MIKLILPGSIRSKKNSKRLIAIPAKGKSGLYKKYKHKGMVPVRVMIKPSTAYEAWEKEARASRHCQNYAYTWKPLDIAIHVKALIYYKGQRPDLSGAMESIGDCLEGIIWEDDSQIESWDGTRLIHDLKNPRTEVEVEVI